MRVASRSSAPTSMRRAGQGYLELENAVPGSDGHGRARMLSFGGFERRNAAAVDRHRYLRRQATVNCSLDSRRDRCGSGGHS